MRGILDSEHVYDCRLTLTVQKDLNCLHFQGDGIVLVDI